MRASRSATAYLLVVLLAVLLAVLPAGSLGAQGRLESRVQGGPPPGTGRDSLEARVRVRMGQMVRTQLGLTDPQMRQLMASNRRFEVRRRELLEQEREVRNGLRDELASRDTTRNAQVGVLLERMLSVQRQRIELLEAEQKDLAAFLTPIQRARYFGIEEQVRRRVEEMNDQGVRDGRMRQPPPGVRRPPAAGARRPPAR